MSTSIQQPINNRLGRPRGRTAAAVIAAVAAFATALGGAAAGDRPPAPSAPVPRDPGHLAAALVRAHDGVRAAVREWRSRPGRPGRPPAAVELEALFQQRLYVAITDRPRLAAEVVPLLPDRLRDDARDLIEARRALLRLTPPTRRPLPSFRTGRPTPAARLLAFYAEAERRFGVRWQILAAVHFVETRFGRIRSSSTAGAQGPMQFLPATWRAYGLGGNVHDPHDAILGAANYLRANGARGDVRRALFAYNRSPLYVDAVVRYARRIRVDDTAFLALYSWQVFVRTPSGSRRITGPGLRPGR